MRDDRSHCSLEGDYSCERPRLRLADGGRLVQIGFAQSPSAAWNAEQFYTRGKRSVCKGFSFSSRRRMLNHLNSVSMAAELPSFVTLTLPDSEFDDSVTAFAKKAKAHLDAWFKRLARVCPGACGFWRLEWQSRKSGIHEGKLFPHFHLMLWGLEYRDTAWTNPAGERGREAFVRVDGLQQEFVGLCEQVAASKVFDSLRSAEAFVGRKARGGDEGCMSFFDWVSVSWYHVVDSHNVDHFLAGASVERVRSWGGVMCYCSKYMAKLGEFGFLEEVPIGRSWGVFNRAAIPWAKILELDLDEKTGNVIRRIMRRYLERVRGRRIRAPYGLTLYCNASQFKSFLAREPDPPF